MPAGVAVEVRCDNAGAVSVSRDGSAIYFTTNLTGTRGVIDTEIRRASPEDAPSVLLTVVAGDRLPVVPTQLVPTLSPDGSALAMALLDGDTANLWVQPTAGGPMRAVTDLGTARCSSRGAFWSPDSRYLYAAVADIDADIVLFEGLRP